MSVVYVLFVAETNLRRDKVWGMYYLCFLGEGLGKSPPCPTDPSVRNYGLFVIPRRNNPLEVNYTSLQVLKVAEQENTENQSKNTD